MNKILELRQKRAKMFNLNPTKSGVLIGHYEGYTLGIASNHADPAHWFTRHGKSMDSFRSAVSALMNGTEIVESSDTYTVKKGDTLWGIASAKLGNGSRYPEIKALNGLTSDTISIGQVVKLPRRQP